MYGLGVAPEPFWPSAIPVAFRSAVKIDRAADKAKGQLICLSGPVGVGKSHAAAVLAYRHMNKTCGRMVWIKGSDLGRADRPLDWATAPLAVLDDLQPRTETAMQVALELVSLRIEAQLPLIITTPFAIEDLSQKELQLCGREIGLCSRLSTGWVAMSGNDRRMMP